VVHVAQIYINIIAHKRAKEPKKCMLREIEGNEQVKDVVIKSKRVGNT